jgi:integrase
MPKTTLGKSRTGTWEVRYSERDATGRYRTRTVSTGSKDHSEAKSFQAVFEAQLTQAVHAARGPTIKDILDEYEKVLNTRPHAKSNHYCLRHLEQHLGPLSPADIDRTTIAKYLADRGVMPATVRRELAVLVAAFNEAVRLKMIKRDDVPSVALPPSSPPRDKWLNEEQESEFYALACGHSIGKPRLHRVTRFVCIALDTGQRSEAIRQLRWSQVDFQAGIIDFRIKTKAAASRKKQAVVPISARLRPLLEQAYAERTNDFVVDHPGWINKVFKAFASRAGYGWVTPHVCRHTAATLMLRAGVEIWEAAGVLGNSPAVVASVYGHHAPDRLRSALEKRFA